MFNSHAPYRTAAVLILFFLFRAGFLSADVLEFSRTEMSFKNFMQCELTRTDAISPFKGKPFKITMIDLFDIQTEGDVTIVTGAVKCYVDDTFQTLYAAVGIQSIMDTDQVMYYTLRPFDFHILATELLKFPYKERCKWYPYQILSE